MKVSIVIVNWNAKNDLLAAIASVIAKTQELAYEIIVVDNASHDQSPAAVREKFPQVTVIESEKNRGFNGGNNLGIQKAQGEYILLLNPDTELQNNTIKILCDYLDAHPAVGGVGPMILNDDGTVQLTCARRMPTWWSEFNEAHLLGRAFPNSRFFADNEMRFWDHHDSRPIEALSGACLLFRKSVIEKTSLLDEHYFIYGDDLDLCMQITKAGYSLYYNAAAVVLHHGGHSTRQIPLKRIWMDVTSKSYFMRKNRGPVQWLLYLPSAAIVLFRQSIVAVIRLALPKKNAS